MVASCDLASSRIFTETFQERLQVSDTVATPPQDRLNFSDDSNQAILGKDTSKLSFLVALQKLGAILLIIYTFEYSIEYKSEYKI